MFRRSLVIATITAVSALALAPTFAVGQTAPAPTAQTAEQIVDRVQAVYDQAKTFKSTFKQRYTAKAYGKTKESAGEVIFEKPGKMSWRYTSNTSNGNRVVSDGKLVKVYEKENKQMFEQALDKSDNLAALSFLTGSGKLKQSFTFERANAQQMGFEGGFVLVGTPISATPAYQKIFLFVDGATYQVRRVLLLDAQGNKNRFDFTRPQVNVKAPSGEFKFTPPPGTQLVR
jgi:outer membrane lipoprotein carrier protein